MNRKGKIIFALVGIGVLGAAGIAAASMEKVVSPKPPPSPPDEFVFDPVPDDQRPYPDPGFVHNVVIGLRSYPRIDDRYLPSVVNYGPYVSDTDYGDGIFLEGDRFPMRVLVSVESPLELATVVRGNVVGGAGGETRDLLLEISEPSSPSKVAFSRSEAGAVLRVGYWIRDADYFLSRDIFIYAVHL